ncbi:MAG: Fe-S cluster assembly protein SufD, partial [Lysobacterales bacterium]
MASALLESLLGGIDATASAARRDAAAALLRDGLPGARDEAWKYTSLRALEQRRYAAGDPAAAARAVGTDAFAWPEIAGPRLVFVNGAFRPDLSALPMQAGLTIGRLLEQRDAFAPPAPTDHFAAARHDAFLRLNAALAMDGPLIRVAAGVRVAMPLHLVFVGAAGDADIAWQLRALVELGENAALDVVEHHV